MTRHPVLHGVRILDLSQGAAGSLATLLLAEAGADVIKAEPPEGDVLRPTPGFLTYNRSKRGLLLDLRTSAGRERLADLLPTLDVLVHGFRPGAEARFGLLPQALAQAAPRLTVGRLRAYPPGHPDEGRPGWDPLVLARLRLLDEQPGWRPGPIYLRLPLASLGASYLLAIGVLARLSRRLRTGQGGVVTTSLA
jgi:crotonobetainyl-CoA:carnitine CoA-transferase CaiB-like acyl-CoA transferase